jgi:hypothetical protein
VHAWATLYLYKYERTLGRADLRFLERSFQGLMLNFNWWVNRKDPSGRNVFAGGFLGLDNIGVFDRSAQLPTGGSLEQADGTAWMAFYCQCMGEIALILAEYDPMYEEIAFRFLQHFMWIAYAMDRLGEHHDEMWDEQDGFLYDLLRLPDGQAMRLKVRSLVGLLPLCASTVFEADATTRYPRLMEMIALFRKRHPELVSHVAPTDGSFIGYKGRRLLSILNRQKLERVLGYMLDENEFLTRLRLRPTRCSPDERKGLRSRENGDRIAAHGDHEVVSWSTGDRPTTGAGHEHTTIGCRDSTTARDPGSGVH